jgi:peptidyl-tRNA hydrolase, PTH1 family
VTDFKLVVGLGNPGARYAQNRHNIGFQIVEGVAKAHGLTFSKNEHKAETAHGRIGDRRVILAKPQTWMNNSGQSVSPLAAFYKVAPEALLVVYDDLDIPLNTVRFRDAGGSGGHRGVQSIIDQLGTDAFPRLRIGIGRPPGRMDPAAYVLQDFSEEEAPLVWEVQRTAQRLIEDWLLDAPPLQRQGMTWRVEIAD